MKQLHTLQATASDILKKTERKLKSGMGHFRFPKRLAFLVVFCSIAAFAKAQAPILIDGFLYDDGNGIVSYPTVYPGGNTITNGTPINKTFYNAPIYMYLVNSSFQLIDVAQPDVAGHFVLHGFQSTSYTVTLSTDVHAINDNVQFANTLPATVYQPVAEGSTTNGDAFADYAVAVSSATNITLYFGIDRRPVNNDFNIPVASITYGGSGRETFPAAAFTGSDGEDAPGGYPAGFATRSVRFFPPTGGVLFYNSLPVVFVGNNPTTISNFNVSLLELQHNPVPGRISFAYSILDSAGIPSFTPSNITVQNPLPVVLSDFNGKIEAGNALLQWTTSMEVNSSGFDVERSLDGVKFSPIGNLKSRGVNGSSNWELKYNYTDPEVASIQANDFYYRLKQMDLNDHFVYSKTIRLSKNNTQWSDEVNTYPNPSKGIINIDAPLASQQDITVSVTNMIGQVMTSKTVTSEANSLHISMDISTLPKGSYLLKVKGQDGFESTKKVELMPQ